MSDVIIRKPTAHSLTIHRDRQRLWLRLFSCSASVEKRIRTKLKEDFKTSLPRFGIMAALTRIPEGLVLSDLAAAVRVSNATVTGIVSGLCAEGLATRESTESDRRMGLVKLTAPGREAFMRIARVHAEWIEHTFAGLTDEQVETLLELLGTVRLSIAENRL